MGRSATDIENAAFRAAIEQLPMKIPVQQAYRFFLFPYATMSLLALVQTARAFYHGKLAIKRL
jgi:hypothetical protein